MRAFAVLVACALAPIVLADEAPDSPAEAIDVGEGTLTGSLSPGDPADWFRVELPAGLGARMRIQSDGAIRSDPHLRVLTDDMVLIGGGGPTFNEGVLVAGVGAPIRVGVVLPESRQDQWQNWSLAIAFVPTADVRIVAARVEFAGIGGSGAMDIDGVPGFERVLAIDLENRGALASDAWALLDDRSFMSTGAPSDDDTDGVIVPAGGTARIVERWTDACASNGAVEFSVMASGDGNPYDNSGTVGYSCPIPAPMP